MHTISNRNIAEIKARCRQIIDGFHHRAALREDDVRTWIAGVVGMHGEQAIWHATRASGFGGSDIGVLVRNFLGSRADHQASAHDIVEAKLLRCMPDEDMPALRRGHENEPLHAQRFYAKYGATRDEEAFEGLTKAVALRAWMRYSPDDIVLKPADAPNPNLGGRKLLRVLIDYKAPSEVDQGPVISFQYGCQLHQGAMLCAAKGIHLDGMMLSQQDWANWCLKDDLIPYDPGLAQLILQAGDHYWAHVLRGEVPPYVVSPRFEQEESLVEKYGVAAQRLAQMKALAFALKQEVEAAEDELKKELDGFRLGDSKVRLGELTVSTARPVDQDKVRAVLSEEQITAVSVKGSPSYDADGMEAHLRERGVNMKQFRRDKIDANKAFAMLEALGLDPEVYISEQLRFTPEGSLKDAAVDSVASIFPRIKVDEPLAAHLAKDMDVDGPAAGGAPALPAKEVSRGALHAPSLAVSARADAAEVGSMDVRGGTDAARLAPRTAMA